MSYYDTKQALTQKFVDAAILPNDSIAVENDQFISDGKNIYVALYFIPATSEMLGKTFASSNQDRGIFQASVFIKKNSGTYDNEQLQLIDNIISEFSYNSETTYNNQTVYILESTVNNGVENDAWFRRDVSINYLTFSTR